MIETYAYSAKNHRKLSKTKQQFRMNRNFILNQKLLFFESFVCLNFFMFAKEWSSEETQFLFVEIFITNIIKFNYVCRDSLKKKLK